MENTELRMRVECLESKLGDADARDSVGLQAVYCVREGCARRQLRSSWPL